MTKNAVIFHGTGGNEESYWTPWLKQELEKQGFDVWTPSLTDSNGSADLELWQKETEQQAPTTEFDLMVGHSAGVPHILRLLSQDFKSKRVVCVAGFMRPLRTTPENHPCRPRGFDIPKIKENSQNFTFIHSDNDPWGCDIKQGEEMRDTFNGTLIIKSGDGHFGSTSYDQPYKKFPMLLAHCLLEG